MKTFTKERVSNGWNSFLNQLGKLGDQRHLSALRDGFALLVPLMVAASIGVISMTFIFGWWQTTSTSILGWITWGIPGQVETKNGIVDFVQGSVAKEISSAGTFVFYTIWKGIFSFLSIFATITISYSLAVIKGTKDPFIASLIGVGSFMILTYGDTSLFDSNGLLVSILASLLSVELYTYFERNEKLQLKMPAGVPPAVGRSFSKLFPTIFTLLIMIGLQAPFLLMTGLTTGFGMGDWFSIGKAISTGIQAPFLGLIDSQAGSYAIGFCFIVFGALLWFLGLHGNNILTGVFSPIFLAGLAANQEWLESGKILGSPTAVADGTQDAFIYFGGTGITLALVLIGLFIAKRKTEREILKFGATPAIFNINEPIVFGLPLVLNFTYFVPYILSQAALWTTTWLAIEELQWVPPVIVKIPWTTPVAIGGFLATSSWQGILLALFNFVLAAVIWLPFVLFSNIRAKKQGEDLVQIDYKGGFNKFMSKFNKNKNVQSEEVVGE